MSQPAAMTKRQQVLVGDLSGDTPALPCWQHTLCTLLSDHIWPHLSAPSKQRLRLTSRALKEAADSSVHRVQLVTARNVMKWGTLKCWQPRQLVILPNALHTSGWEHLGTQPHPRLVIQRFTARLEAVIVHAPVMPELLMQVLEPCLGQLTRLELLRPPGYSRYQPWKGLQLCPVPWAQLGRLQAVVLQKHDLQSEDMSGLKAMSSTLASLELGLNKGKAALQAGTLAALTRLTHLKLTIHKDDLMGNMEEALAALTGLHSLHVTPPLQVSRLTGLQQLTSLSVTHSHIADASGIAHLAAIGHLQHLTVQASGSQEEPKASFCMLTALTGLRSLAAYVPEAAQPQQATSIATLTQLTRLELKGKRLRDYPPREMDSLSSLCNLRVFKLYNSSYVGGWFPACMAAWRQLQELHVPELHIKGADLQALAVLPSLRTLHCNFTFRGAGCVQLASLEHLTCTFDSVPCGTPAELAAFSAPQLKTVEGLHRVDVWWPKGAENQEQFLADIARAVEGILQWAPELHVATVWSHDIQGMFLSALHRWQPVQGGERCELDLSRWYNNNPAPVINLPPVVQCLRLGGFDNAETLATLAGNPHLEDVCYRAYTLLSFDRLVSLMNALAKQPPSMAPLRIHGAFFPSSRCMAEAADYAKTAGGRPLLLVDSRPNCNYDSGSESEGSEYSSD